MNMGTYQFGKNVYMYGIYRNLLLLVSLVSLNFIFQSLRVTRFFDS